MLAALASATAAVVAGCPGGTDPEDSGPATSQSSGTGETSTGTGSDPTATVDRSTDGRDGAATSPSTTGPSTTTAGDGTEDGPLPMSELVRTPDGRELRLSNPSVHPLILTPKQVSHHVYHRVTPASRGEQYLVVEVYHAGFDDPPVYAIDGPDTEPPRLPFVVELDGERYRSGRTLAGIDNDGAIGQVAIPVPVGEVASGAVVWERPDGPSLRWELPPDARSALSSAPAFGVRSVEFPDEVAYGDDVRVSFTVANTGGRAGRFLVELDARAGSLPLGERRVTVPAGESVTQTAVISPTYYPDIREVPVVFDWGRHSRSAAVEVVYEPTATPTRTE